MRKTLARKPGKTKDALQIIDRMIGTDTKLRELVAEAEVNAHIAQLIYNARRAAGLTQADLARLIGTKQPVIARLEDADYRGHSLNMPQRVAAALHQRLVVRFTPATNRQHQPRHELRA
jgi:ribosome-binding protein aMBF1 (putative translation factor)